MPTPTDSRTYVGRFEAGAQMVYVVDSEGVERLDPPAGGFGWGRDATGSTEELARLMLTDVTGIEPGQDACQSFTAGILSRLPHDGFALQRDTVGAWLRRTVTI